MSEAFKYEPRLAIIEFDEPFKGLEIRASLDLSATRQLRVMKQLEKLQTITQTGDEEQAEAAFREAMELFIAAVDGWNWQDSDGNPVPLTADTLCNHIPGSLAFSLVDRWAAAVRGVDAPLGETSSSGNDSPDRDIQTLANLSESLSS